MAYTTIDDPSAFFQTILYEGGTADAKTFSGNSDLALNWFWGKKREVVQSPYFVDSVRGIVNSLQSNVTAAEYTDTEADDIASFDSNGFTFNDTGDQFNGTSTDASYVAWCWKAGTAFSNDASSTSIGSIDSAGSVNDTAGFSIVTYTGTGSNATVKHGLSTKPSWILVKGINTDENWINYYGDATDYLQLNSNVASVDAANIWQDTHPTTSVFSIGDSGKVNNDGSNYVAYCFANKKGYSKASSYIGNGSATGPFIFTGFRPALVLLKSHSNNVNWKIFDNKRDPFNDGTGNTFNVNENGAEDDNTAYAIDFLSNGFRVPNTNGNMNPSGETITYLAFAHNPFVTSTGIPATAR